MTDGASRRVDAVGAGTDRRTRVDRAIMATRDGGLPAATTPWTIADPHARGLGGELTGRCGDPRGVFPLLGLIRTPATEA